MTIPEFNRLKNFKWEEKNHKGERLCDVERIEVISLELMLYTDSLTTEIKRKFWTRNPVCIIHHITSGSHTDESVHPLGLAIDVEYPRMSVYEQVMMASLFPFTGIGFYPYSRSLFMHLDIKEIELRRRMWYRDIDGNYIDYRDIQAVLHKLRGHYVETTLNGSD